jgi:hypothetical protein
MRILGLARLRRGLRRRCQHVVQPKSPNEIAPEGPPDFGRQGPPGALRRYSTLNFSTAALTSAASKPLIWSMKALV